MLIHIGFGNMVNTAKIIAVVSPDSAPMKRLVQNAKSVLVMENSQIVLSALLPETLAGRVQAGAEALEEEEE